MSNNNLDWLLNAPIAHRGLHDENIPENSIPAFEKAIEHGFNIEIDVHLSKDGHLVVFHDADLKRMCGVDKAVKDCTLDELKTYRLKDTDCTIPTLDEFLDLVDGKVGILCEVKGLSPFDKSIAQATVDRFKSYKGNVALQSFNFGAVICFRKDGSRPFGQLITWGWKDAVKCSKMNWMGKLHICKISKPQFIAYDVRTYLDAEKYINKQRKKGKPLLLWTINTPEKLDLARKVADNIIFEKPSGLLDENN
jgi:glycerophosphoryl diester phosphodiesterase